MLSNKYFVPEYNDVKDLFPDKEQYDLHVNLFKNYIKKVDNEGDTSDFQKGGRFLHVMYFEQFRQLSEFKQPYGQVTEFLNKHFGSYSKFKDAFIEECKNLHGSGWVYLNRNGKIKTIKNHTMLKDKDIVIIVDMWEHAWQCSDSPKEKDKYLKNIWKYFAWDIIQARLPLVESQTMRFFMNIID